MQVEWCRARIAVEGGGGGQKRVGGGDTFDWGCVKDEGSGRGDVEVAGTGGKTAGGEGLRKKMSW